LSAANKAAEQLPVYRLIKGRETRGYLLRWIGAKIEYQRCDSDGAPSGEEWALWADFSQCKDQDAAPLIAFYLMDATATIADIFL
jgi:hypothetical protein